MAFVKEKVLEVRHHTKNLFHFKTTRASGTRFRDGEFLMMGLEVDGKPLLRAYQVASPYYKEHLEWFSINVPNSPLTSRFRHIKVGDEIIINTKAVGTLVMNNLKSERNLYMLTTGTGVAPFISLARGPETYEQYDRVIPIWGTRYVNELAFKDLFENLNEHEVWGDTTQGKFVFYPSVKREDYKNTGRITDAIYSGAFYKKTCVPSFDREKDSVMLCGSMPMSVELKEYFEGNFGCVEGSISVQGDLDLEKSFVEK